MNALDSLNQYQLEAVKSIHGPVLVLAGAGSGKTKTLTARIVHMIEQGIKPESILAVTFTNKAAREMRDRVESFIPNSSVLISTFHAFGARILRQYISVLGFDPNFNIYDTDDQKKIIFSLKKAYDTEINVSRTLSKISQFKERGILPDQIVPKTQSERVLLEIYKNYQLRLKEGNALDFTDLLIHTNSLLNIDSVLQTLRSRFKYVLVDEYQDTNVLQYKIVKQLCAEHRNIFVVGDEDQSIYKFRGADIGNILNFEQDYEDAKVFKLEENYRSTGNILSVANGVIKNNKSSMGKRLRTNRGEGELVVLFKSDDSKREAKYIVGKIKELACPRKDIAVLYRNNFQSRELEEELLRESVPHKIYGGIQFYQRKEIKDIFAYLNLINNNKDVLSFFRIINVPARGLGQITLDKIAELKNTSNHPSLIEATREASTSAAFSLNIRNSLKEFLEVMDSLANDAKSMNIFNLIDAILKKTNYMQHLAESGEPDRVENARELLSSVSENNLSLGEYLETVALAGSTDKMMDNEDCVKLMTVHNSKGLEFPVVFVTGLEEELFPHVNSFMNQDDIEEERRLFYVALTRAKDRLFLTYSKARMQSGIIHHKPKSRFLNEIDESLIVEEKIELIKKRTSEALFRAIEDMKIRKEREKVQLEENNLDKINKLKDIVGFALGERVSHRIFGTGKVVSLSLEKVTVLFDEVGEKKFMSKDISNFIQKY